MRDSLRQILSRLYSRAEANLFPLRHKERKEVAYWQYRLSEEGQLQNHHYLQSYTLPFDLQPAFGRETLRDIGCGSWQLGVDRSGDRTGRTGSAGTNLS